VDVATDMEGEEDVRLEHVEVEGVADALDVRAVAAGDVDAEA
jgi:hypothetical protein